MVIVLIEGIEVGLKLATIADDLLPTLLCRHHDEPPVSGTDVIPKCLLLAVDREARTVLRPHVSTLGIEVVLLAKSSGKIIGQACIDIGVAHREQLHSPSPLDHRSGTGRPRLA